MTTALVVFVFYLVAATLVVSSFWILQIRFGDTKDLDPSSFLVRKLTKRHLRQRCNAGGAIQDEAPQIGRVEESPVGTKKLVAEHVTIADFYQQVPLLDYGYDHPGSTKSVPEEELVDQVMQGYGQRLERYKEIVKTVSAAIDWYEQNKEKNHVFPPPYRDPHQSEKRRSFGDVPWAVRSKTPVH